MGARLLFLTAIAFLLALCCTHAMAQGPPPIVWLGGGHAGGINQLLAATDGSIWTAGNDLTVKQWRSSDLSLQRTLLLDYTAARGTFSRDGMRGAVLGSKGYQPVVKPLSRHTIEVLFKS